MTDVEHATFDAALVAFEKGDIQRLEGLAQERNFSHGEGSVYNDHWLSHAVTMGNVDSVAWVLSKGVEVNLQI